MTMIVISIIDYECKHRPEQSCNDRDPALVGKFQHHMAKIPLIFADRSRADLGLGAKARATAIAARRA